MMPAGRYYIGDLCYVLDKDWDEFCALTIKDHECLDGEFTFKDGRRFATYGTAYGDGCYPNNISSFNLPVDAGLIGCVRVEDCEVDINMGIIVDFPEPFSTSEKEGVISFGHVHVDTACEDDEEDYYEDEE